MGSSGLNESKTLAILRQVEVGARVADLSCEHGITARTIYSWRATHGSPNRRLRTT